jgi:multiple antibiotic resistance protein
MVGAGTISITLLISKNHPIPIGIGMIVAAVALSIVIILIMKQIRRLLAKRKLEIAFDKNMEILIRLNGFFVGAIGINMILTGIQKVFFK